MKVILKDSSAEILLKSRLEVFNNDTIYINIKEEGLNSTSSTTVISSFDKVRDYLSVKIDTTNLILNRTYEFTLLLNSSNMDCEEIILYKGRFLVQEKRDVQDFKRTYENDTKLYL